MKALSLWQPHALAIGLELKPWETRGWSTDYRGPVAIHAAKRSWTDAGPWHSTARQILAEYVARRGPVPWIRFRSTPASRARRRVAGEARTCIGVVVRAAGADGVLVVAAAAAAAAEGGSAALRGVSMVP